MTLEDAAFENINMHAVNGCVIMFLHHLILTCFIFLCVTLRLLITAVSCYGGEGVSLYSNNVYLDYASKHRQYIREDKQTDRLRVKIRKKTNIWD